MQLYDTLTRGKQELPPPPGPIRMYTCGPTVYQRVHIGNARPFVISMWLRRWLAQRGYDVTLVENITDVNDKIYDAAPGHSAQLAAQASLWYVQDTEKLGLGRPDHEPKATETIPEILALIEQLVRDDHAYVAGDDVYFRVASFPGYGELSGQQPDQLEDDEPSPLKEDPRDFALWKATKEGEDTSWDSPWGRGRPGWHIECSAMAEKFLGPSFEIHLGGLDLLFPHHENERAQSQAAGREFARLWMHNGMLELVGEKMSKSLGNVTSLHDVVERWGRETVLVFFLTGHWSKPIDFSDETMLQAAAQAETFRNAFRSPPPASSTSKWKDLVEALDDDFDTPRALAILHSWRRAGDVDLLEDGLRVFGLDSLRPHVVSPAGIASDEALGAPTVERYYEGDPPPQALQAAEKRHSARLAGDYEMADHLRNVLAHHAWIVEDVETGFRLKPIPPIGQSIGNRPAPEAIQIADRLFRLLQRWADAEATAQEGRLAALNLKLEVVPNGYVISQLDRSR